MSSNTWGFLILTVLLGYGLVEVPRSLWKASKRGMIRKACYIKAAKLFAEMMKADALLVEVNAVSS